MNFFGLDKTQFLLWIFKNLKILFSFSWPTAHSWSQDQHAQSCDIDSGTYDFRLDSSCWFYLYKFSLVVHTKCSFLEFVWTTKAKFTVVKQARWVKPEVTCSLIYITTISKRREDWREWWTKMAANSNVFKTSKKDCILFKSNFSF